MGKSVTDIIKDAAEKMCSDYCKYTAEAMQLDGDERELALDKVWSERCIDCPINDLW